MTTPPPTDELELKLRFRPEDEERLTRHPLLRRHTRGRASTRVLNSVYYDTPALALFHRGLALRLRDIGQDRVQTVKTLDEGEAGLFHRREDEVALPALSPPQLGAVADPLLRAALAEEIGRAEDGLEALVETEVRRTKRLLVFEDTEIECAVDVGEVRTASGARPIRELELELISGDPARLYEVALQILESVPLVPSSVGKAEVGFAQITGASPKPSKARGVRYERDATLDDVLSALFSECVRQISVNRPCVEAGEDPEGVHQMRVGIRRLRSVISLFRHVLPADSVAALRDELRWLGGELGRARDLDVLLDELLDPMLEVRPDDPGLRLLRDEARVSRAQTYASLRQIFESPRFGTLLILLGAWVERRGWRQQVLTPDSARIFQPALPFAREVLDRRLRAVRKRGRHIRVASPEQLHELRIQAKKLRYACEFLSPLFEGEAAAEYAKQLARLQTRLGHLNDAETAQTLLDAQLARLGSEPPSAAIRGAGFAAGYAARGATESKRGLRRAWKRFHALPAYWRG